MYIWEMCVCVCFHLMLRAGLKVLQIGKRYRFTESNNFSFPTLQTPAKCQLTRNVDPSNS